MWKHWVLLKKSKWTIERIRSAHKSGSDQFSNGLRLSTVNRKLLCNLLLSELKCSTLQCTVLLVINTLLSCPLLQHTALLTFVFQNNAELAKSGAGYFYNKATLLRGLHHRPLVATNQYNSVHCHFSNSCIFLNRQKIIINSCWHYNHIKLYREMLLLHVIAKAILLNNGALLQLI